ncbi:MAG: hypothetical protein HFE77_02710 [Clostridiales bacterium]|nr:hypothetical protein [Clostridiales bacterium]
MKYIGNGKMIAALDGPNIMSIHAPSISAPALCSLVCKEIVKTRIQHADDVDIFMHMNHNDHLQFRCTDLIDPEDCIFVRKIDTYDRASFKICVPPNASFTVYKHTSKMHRAIISLPKGSAFSTGLSTKEESFLLIAACGNCIIRENGIIDIQTGNSFIYFISGDPAEFYKLDNEIPSYNTLYQRVAEKSDRLSSHKKIQDILNKQSKTGGVISSTYLGECVISKQREYLQTLLAAKQIDRAKGIIDYLLKLYQVNGFMPYSASVDYEPIKKGALSNAVTPAFAALCAKDYYDATGDKKFIRSRIKLIAQITNLQTLDIKTSHLSFNGGEALFDGTRPSSMLFEGSLLSDKLFLESAEALLYLIDEIHCSVKRTAALTRAHDKVKAALSDYEINGQCLINYYNRYSIARKPKTLYFHCEYCHATKLQTYERLCIRNKFGHYVCPECLQDKPPEDLQYSSDLTFEEAMEMEANN